MQDFTNFNPNQQPGSFAVVSENSEAAFFQRVYAWMFAALGVTALVGFLMSRVEPWVYFLLTSPLLVWLAVAMLPVGMAFYLRTKVESMSPGAVKGWLMAIAAGFGATTLTVCFALYKGPAFITAFVCAASIFGAMAVYGLVTKRSLQAWGSFLLMGVVGLLVAMGLNLFLQNGPLDYVICIVGVIVFAGLTAYDHQKLRVMYFSATSEGADEDTLVRYGLMGSLALYIDFLNLFVFLLRLVGHDD